MNELLLIDKPAGITSFDVIRILRKATGIRKMGHAGTLDPAATGLMIIATGTHTKKLKNLIGLPKTYDAEILLGTQTDTGDLDGTVIAEQAVPALSDEMIQSVLADMTGAIDLPVPKYSAIKRGGKPLYKYAREGYDITPPVKTMRIYKTTYTGRADNRIAVTLDVSSGTYVRSIAEEIGKRLGTVATLASLRRTSIGPYSVADAEPLN